MPHAIAVGNEVIQVFDPIVHDPVDAAADAGRRRSIAPSTGDERWIRCERPVVLSGGELTLCDARPRLRRAHRLLPGAAARQGQQRHLHRRRPRPPAGDAARPDEPLDRAAGPAHRLPVAAHRPQVHGAVRRGGGVLHQPAARPTSSTRPSCAGSATRSTSGRCRRPSTARSSATSAPSYGIPYAEPMFADLLRDYHDREDKPLLACYPRDLLSQLRDFAIYAGRRRRWLAEASSIGPGTTTSSASDRAPPRRLDGAGSRPRHQTNRKRSRTMKNTRALVMIGISVVAALGAVWARRRAGWQASGDERRQGRVAATDIEIGSRLTAPDAARWPTGRRTAYRQARSTDDKKARRPRDARGACRRASRCSKRGSPRWAPRAACRPSSPRASGR